MSMKSCPSTVEDWDIAYHIWPESTHNLIQQATSALFTISLCKAVCWRGWHWFDGCPDGWWWSWWRLLRFWRGVWVRGDGRGLWGRGRGQWWRGIGVRRRGWRRDGWGGWDYRGLWIRREKNRWGGGRWQRGGKEHGWRQRLIFLFLNLSLELDQCRRLNAIPEGEHLFSSDWEKIWWGHVIVNDCKGSKDLTLKQFSQVAWDTSTHP